MVTTYNHKYATGDTSKASLKKQRESLERKMFAADCSFAAQMPNTDTLKKAYKLQANAKQRRMIRDLSKNEDRIEGMLGVGTMKTKLIDKTVKTDAQKYVQNFSHNHDVF